MYCTISVPLYLKLVGFSLNLGPVHLLTTVLTPPLKWSVSECVCDQSMTNSPLKRSIFAAKEIHFSVLYRGRGGEVGHRTLWEKMTVYNKEVKESGVEGRPQHFTIFFVNR